MDKSKIGKRIKQHREAAELTQDFLAEKTCLSSNFISYIERGEKLPSLENFIKIANVIEVSADTLLEDVLKNSHKQLTLDYIGQIEKLPSKDRQRVFAILETVIRVLTPA